MNYPEYVLRRSESLWQELEEAWRRELATAAGVAHGSGAGTEAVGEENAVKRLAEKLFPSGGKAAEEAVQALTAQERGLNGLAETFGANAVRGGSDGARWLADELRRGATEGVAPERTQERGADAVSVYETAALQTLSQSAERDARRYDGGFLLY